MAEFVLGATSNGGGTGAPGPDGQPQGPSLGQRLANGGLAATEGYDKFINEQKQLQAAGKAGKYYFDANPDALAEMGKTPEEAKNFGSRDWAALAQAHSQKQTMAEMQARMDEQAAQSQYYGDRGADYNAQAQQRTQDNAADQNFAQLFLKQTQPQMQPGGPTGEGSPLATTLMGMKPAQTPQPNPQDILKLMLQSGIRPEVALQRAGQFKGGDQEDNTPQQIAMPDGTTLFVQKHTKNPPIISPVVKQKNAEDLLQDRLNAKPNPAELTEAQKQNLIVQHGNARSGLMKQLETLNTAMYPDIAKAINDELADHANAIAALRRPKASGPSQPAAPAESARPTRDDVTYLAAHPEVKERFEAKFGKGTAAQWLP